METKDAVLKILTDAIIFDRVVKGMNILLDAFNTAESEWEASEQYQGYANAFYFLDVKDEEIMDQLGDAFHLTIRDNDDIEHARDMASIILNGWHRILNDRKTA